MKKALTDGCDRVHNGFTGGISSAFRTNELFERISDFSFCQKGAVS